MGYGGDRERQHVLHAGPRRHRHLQDDPGHGQARIGHVLKLTAEGFMFLADGRRRADWNSPVSLANMEGGTTANLEGEPSSLAYRYACLLERLQNAEIRQTGPHRPASP